MDQSKVQRILNTPITLLRWTTSAERWVFPYGKEGLFCTFGLESQQTFVGHIPLKGNTFTFRPLHNELPYLKEIIWVGSNNVADLGYTTICQLETGASQADQEFYEQVLSPKRDTPVHYPCTKIAFKYYVYHPLLQTVRCIQSAILEYREKEKAFLGSRNHLQSLLFSENNLAPLPVCGRERE